MTLTEERALVLDRWTRLRLRRAYREAGNWSAAARALGMDRSNLRRLKRILGVKTPDRETT